MKSSSWIIAFCFQDNGSFMNGCSGSGATRFCAVQPFDRKTSESVDSSNNHKVTLCAFRRRPIVLSICPMNFSGSGAVAKTSKLCASASHLSARHLLGSAQRLFGAFAFSYIDNGAHELHQITGLIANRMTDCVDVLDDTARVNNPVICFEVRFCREWRFRTVP